jgi:uncharacterized protein (TIGR00730 family)
MARNLTSIAVFCGSNTGEGTAYRDGAAALGRELARRGITLVYGGTHMGLMGVLADAVLAEGGRAHGVITERLEAKGHLHPRLTLRETVMDMHARKARMLDLADACIALPGGIGTLEEFMEAWTLNQLGHVDKPAGLLDIEGFFAPLVAQIDLMVARRFLPREHREALPIAGDPATLIDLLQAYAPPIVQKWL